MGTGMVTIKTNSAKYPKHSGTRHTAITTEKPTTATECTAISDARFPVHPDPKPSKPQDLQHSQT